MTLLAVKYTRHKKKKGNWPDDETCRKWAENRHNQRRNIMAGRNDTTNEVT